MLHREYFVSDGKDATLANRLGGESEFTKIHTFIMGKILYAWQVPPQRLGINVNSERMASANTLTERTLEQYETYLRIIKRLVEQALETLTRFKANPNIYIKLCPSLNPWTLQRLEPILTTQVVQEFYACTYGLPENYFSTEAIKKRQELAVGEDQVVPQKEEIEGNSEFESDQPKAKRDRKSLDQDEKDKRQREKGIKKNV